MKRKSGKELAVSNYQKLLKNPCSQKYTLEEIITSEIQKEIKKVSLPDDWAKWMLAENEKDKLVEVQSSTLFADSTKADISLLDSKIEKLMDAYLENALSLDEYRNMKNKLVNEKQLLKEKLSAFEQKANNRFELTEKFLKYNIELANEGINEEKLHLYKKVGSNFQIKDRTIFFEPRGAWRILLDSEFGGWNAEQTALRADNIFGGNLNSEFWRRRWDLNPREDFSPASLAARCFRPLSHVSVESRISNLVRESERDDVFCAGSFKRIDGGLKRGASGEHVVYYDVGASGICLVQGAKCATHILFALVAGKRDLRNRLMCTDEYISSYFYLALSHGAAYYFFYLIKTTLFLPLFPKRYWHYIGRRTSYIVTIA